MQLGVYIGCGVKRLAWYGPKLRHANSQTWDTGDARPANAERDNSEPYERLMRDRQLPKIGAIRLKEHQTWQKAVYLLPGTPDISARSVSGVSRRQS